MYSVSSSREHAVLCAVPCFQSYIILAFFVCSSVVSLVADFEIHTRNTRNCHSSASAIDAADVRKSAAVSVAVDGATLGRNSMRVSRALL